MIMIYFIIIVCLFHYCFLHKLFSHYILQCDIMIQIYYIINI